jgi:nucleotide-binding universal stress UspA family protein
MLKIVTSRIQDKKYVYVSLYPKNILQVDNICVLYFLNQHQEKFMIKYKNILYPINLDSKSQSTVTPALEFAIFFKSKIHFLYVNDKGAGYRYPTDFNDAVALKVLEVTSKDLIEKSDIVYAISKGDIGQEVKKYSEDNNIDLIITAHKHRNILFSSLLDSSDENIIDRVTIPVLILPEN